MTVGVNQPERYRIGDLELSTGTQQLLRDGDEIHLPRLSFAMLLTLARHAPDIMTLDRLAEEVWDGVAISDSTVFQRVKLLRQALGDDSDNPRYIASVRGRGYRLIAGVERIDGVADTIAPPSARDSPRPSAERPGRRPRLAVWLAVAATALVVIAAFSRGRRPAENTMPRRMAVLPITNLDGDRAGDVFAAGLTEQLTQALARADTPRVVTRTLVETLGSRNRRVRDLGRELDVDTLVDGSVRTTGDSVRISIRLIDAASEELSWARDYQGSSSDVLMIQDEVAEHVAVSMSSALARGDRTRPEAISFARLQALDHFARGHRAYLRYRREDTQNAVEFFQRALEIDPDFAIARAWLANAYAQLAARHGLAETWAERAIATAQEALRLEPELPEAHNAIGVAHLRLGRQELARRSFERTLQLRPGHPQARYSLESLDELRR